MNGYILLGITGEGKSPEIRKFSRFKIVPIFIISSKSTEVRSGSMVHQFSYYGSCLVLRQLFLVLPGTTVSTDLYNRVCSGLGEYKRTKVVLQKQFFRYQQDKQTCSRNHLAVVLASVLSNPLLKSSWFRWFVHIKNNLNKILKLFPLNITGSILA